MAQWGKSDAASNSVLWVGARVKTTANAGNRDAIFGNTTQDAFITGAAIGQFGVDGTEVAANPAVAHTGWVLRTEGSGGRAGRVQYETLVAGGIGTDAEDVVMVDYVLRVTTQPTSKSANGSNNDVATFSVAGASTPTGATLGYLWQYSVDSGNNWSTTVGNTSFSGQTTTTLSVNSNTAANGTVLRAVISATGAANVTSTSATLTVTA